MGEWERVSIESGRGALFLRLETNGAPMGIPSVIHIRIYLSCSMFVRRHVRMCLHSLYRPSKQQWQLADAGTGTARLIRRQFFFVHSRLLIIRSLDDCLHWLLQAINFDAKQMQHSGCAMYKKQQRAPRAWVDKQATG